MPELLPYEPGSPEWLAARRAGVTATDIVTILGLSRWDSVYSLFWRKLGQVPEVEDNDRFRLGRELEPYIGNRWAESARSDGQTFLLLDGALYRHRERPWQMATTDRIVNMSRDGRPLREHAPAVLELKSWADADRHSWGISRALYTGRVGDDGEHLDPEPPFPPDHGTIPPAVRAQVLWQMDVMGVATGHVGVVFLPSGEFRSYTIEHNGGLHAGYMITAAEFGCEACADLHLMHTAGEEFMGRLRLELPPPDPDSSTATLAAVKARFARQPAKQAEVDRIVWDDFLHGCQAIEAGKECKRQAEITLREQAGEAAELCVDGQPVARRVISATPVRAHMRHQDYIRRIK